MKLLVSILLIIIVILLTYCFDLHKENNKYKRRAELQESQLLTINQLINMPHQSIKIDETIFKKADYLINDKESTTLLFYSNLKNQPDACIEVDGNNNIKFIGFYKP